MLSGVKHGGNDQFVSSSSDGISMSSVENLKQAMHRIALLQTMSMEDLVVHRLVYRMELFMKCMIVISINN